MAKKREYRIVVKNQPDYHGGVVQKAMPQVKFWRVFWRNIGFWGTETDAHQRISDHEYKQLLLERPKEYLYVKDVVARALPPAKP